jgi:Cytochrome P460
MKRVIVLVTCVVAAGVAFVIGGSSDDPHRIKLPPDYATRYVLYNVVDRTKAKDVLYLYVNPEAAKSAEAGRPAPNGTVIVMEARKAKLDASGTPILDPNGRMVSDDAVAAISIQEKRAGWGRDIPANIRNGDWDYAVFDAKGVLRTDTKRATCFDCHENRAARDYTFTFAKWVLDGKP